MAVIRAIIAASFEEISPPNFGSNIKAIAVTEAPKVCPSNRAVATVPPFLFISKAISTDASFISDFSEKTPAIQSRIDKLQENEQKVKAVRSAAWLTSL